VRLNNMGRCGWRVVRQGFRGGGRSHRGSSPLSAINTAVGALIGLHYMLARDGEMPKRFTRLTRMACLDAVEHRCDLPILVVAFGEPGQLDGALRNRGRRSHRCESGSCTFNWLCLCVGRATHHGMTFLVLFAAEITIAKTKPDALFFACCVLGLGFGLRNYAQRRRGFARSPSAKKSRRRCLQGRCPTSSSSTTLARPYGRRARVDPVLRFALEEARLRQGPYTCCM